MDRAHKAASQASTSPSFFHTFHCFFGLLPLRIQFSSWRWSGPLHSWEETIRIQSAVTYLIFYSALASQLKKEISRHRIKTISGTSKHHKTWLITTIHQRSVGLNRQEQLDQHTYIRNGQHKNRRHGRATRCTDCYNWKLFWCERRGLRWYCSQLRSLVCFVISNSQ